MSNPSVLVFDIGNVLLKWEPYRLYSRYFESEDAMNRFFDEVDFYGWNLKQDAGRSFSKGVEELVSRFPHWETEIKAYDLHWDESIPGAIEGSAAILEQLHAHEYPLYALSNWSAEKFPLMKDRYSFLDCFDDAVLSGSVGVNKPDPAIYEILLDRLERRAEECLFIDDSKANIEAADQLGFHTHLFVDAHGLRERLVELGFELGKSE